MRQCPTCRKIYPKTLGIAGYCSTACEADGLIHSLRADVRLERLAHWLLED
ncbi:MAG TPA: hypothetical protein VGO87_00240 [Acidimicrobiia bacterium]